MSEPRLESKPAEAATRHWDVAVVGAGYVGVPLAQPARAARASPSLLVDVAEDVVAGLNRGDSHIEDVPSEALGPLVDEGRIAATTDYDALRDADAIVIALPTPLSKQREPDLSIVSRAVERDRRSDCARATSSCSSRRRTPARPARSSCRSLEDERARGRARTSTSRSRPSASIPATRAGRPKNVPKVVGGITAACTERAAELYEGAIDTGAPRSPRPRPPS